MASPLASIIIRCYNERDHIDRLLHGISHQSIDDVEIILVDSGSTDGTVEIARDFGVDEILYISPEKFSFGRSLNCGIDAASGEFCIFASAHVYPKRDDWIARLVERFDEESNVALVYGKQRGAGVTSFSERQIFKQWYPEESIIHQDHPFCNNANAAIRREIWEDIKYNERLTGLEDIDWAKRVRQAGYEISYTAEAEIIHVHEESAREIYNRHRREAYAYKQIMSEQSFSFIDFIKLTISHILSDYKNAVSEGVLLLNLLSIPRFRFLQFWGTYRGFNREEPISQQLWQRFYYPDRTNYPSTDRGNNTDARNSEDRGTEIEYPDEIEPGIPSPSDHEVG